jgi:CMP-N-acetylneuraminic acid synthetase
LTDCKLTAVIPIRQGSKRVKNKNFRPFADSSLLKLKIETLQKLKGIDSIVVNTDSEIAISIAKEYGVEYFKREDYFASSICSGSEFFRNLADTTDSEYIMHSPCTAPLVTVETYQTLIDLFLSNKDGFDSFNTVAKVHEYLWKDGKPLNYSIENAPNSQDLPDVFKITFGASIIRKTDMQKYKNIVGKNPLFHKVSEVESVDIDTLVDFRFAEYLYKEKLNG